jgi:hypothetical protein
MGKLIIKIIALPIVGSIIHFMITAILAGLLAMTYTSLTQEKAIATITFEKEDTQSQIYTAYLRTPNGSNIGNYTIYGDQWRIDATFIKMEYWANILGVDSKYTLDRLEGRYKNINDENTKEHKSYKLEGHSLINSFDFFFDTTYGSSVYQDIKLKILYKVLKTQTGLMVREESLGTGYNKNILDRTRALFGF